MFTSHYFINRENVQQSLHTKIHNKNNEKHALYAFLKKRANRSSGKIAMASLSRCDQHKFCPLCTLIIPAPMCWDFKTFLFITLHILSEQFHTKYKQIQQISSQNAGQFRERKGAAIGFPVIGVFCKFLGLWSTMYTCPSSMKKEHIFQLNRTINYITMGLLCPQKLGTACV